MRSLVRSGISVKSAPLRPELLILSSSACESFGFSPLVGVSVPALAGLSVWLSVLLIVAMLFLLKPYHVFIDGCRTQSWQTLPNVHRAHLHRWSVVCRARSRYCGSPG